MEGDYLNYVPGDDSERKLLIDSMEASGREPEVIKRKDIPGYLSPDNLLIISHYQKSKRYGLPYTGDKWALEPCVIMDIIWTLENESGIIQEHRRKQ